ncbi:MAG: SPOR domain-containing protein [Saprospiraceae bacterium]|nr:SPOR domain-containing protein [Saprospiraceae bacterium]
MQLTTILFIVRLMLSLAGGFWLARQLRGLVPGLVLKLMPEKLRFSENAFRIQARIGTVLAAVITLGAASLLYDGLGRLAAQVRTVTQTQFRTVPEQPTPPDDQPYKQFYDPIPPAPEANTPSESLDEPARYYDDVPPPAKTPAVGNAEHWCLQLYAFDDEENARTIQALMARRLPLPAHIAYLQGDTGPYKLYIEGFATRDEAVRFARKHQLNGFPRPAHQLR